MTILLLILIGTVLGLLVVICLLVIQNANLKGDKNIAQEEAVHYLEQTETYKEDLDSANEKAESFERQLNTALRDKSVAQSLLKSALHQNLKDSPYGPNRVVVEAGQDGLYYTFNQDYPEYEGNKT